LFHNGEQMAKGDNLGEFEQLILTALMLLGSRENAYGMTVHAKVEELTAGLRAVSLGACYTTLDRLETKGYVRSWFGGATEERGGRSKRFFEITGTGEQVLRNALRVADNMVSGLREIGGLV
jgi:PadR family transcriptional regulator PadR